VIAHRGASLEAPENTISAFERALDQGADGIALQVHLSKDDQPVVIHDFTLERTTDGSGAVRAHTVRQLKRLDTGGWKAERFRGQRLQTLQEVFERFGERARFWVELKGGRDLYPSIEDRIVSTVEVYDLLDRVVVESFDPGALARLRTMNAELGLGALASDPPLYPLIRSPGAVRAVCPRADLVTEAVARQIREAGLDSYVWTVNEPALMDRLVEWGVSGIVTGRPALLRARLGS
jgi:glycerophosphoryl diester phosphodiesterase